MRNRLTRALTAALASLFALALPAQAAGDPDGGKTAFVKVRGTHFYKGDSDKPLYFVGTNLWYAPILGSTGQGGDRKRLRAELDSLHALGVDNLRILAGADAGSTNANTVRPVLQTKPGELNDTLLTGLDYTLREMAKRGMTAVIYLTNSWDWSGGFGFYLRATGHGDSPNASGDGYRAYVDYAKRFFDDKEAQRLYRDFVSRIVGRTNSLTGKPYRDDPTIMAWQLCNEPRPFGEEEIPAFAEWVRETATLIKQADPNHLVSTGSEGVIGCMQDAELCERVHGYDCIDYITVHIWPANWGWTSRDRLFAGLSNVYIKTQEYLEAHNRIAAKTGKPYVVEEFGYPRDANGLLPTSSTDARDCFYSFLFRALSDSRRDGGAMAGCNFWGWGGKGVPPDKEWKPGADYLCDPPHEPQGWYSVYQSDSTTLNVIRGAVEALR